MYYQWEFIYGYVAFLLLSLSCVFYHAGLHLLQHERGGFVADDETVSPCTSSSSSEDESEVEVEVEGKDDGTGKVSRTVALSPPYQFVQDGSTLAQSACTSVPRRGHIV
jgi:hypothetical protein